MNNTDGTWRTVGGRRIFIKNGQDLATAMKESGKFSFLSKGNSNNLEQIENATFIEKIDLKDADKKILEYENKIRGKEIEYSYVIQEDGNVYLYEGNKDSVYIKNVKNAIITHNHTIDEDIYRSFGEDDFYFIKNNDFRELRITNPDYDYSLKKIKEFDNINYNVIYKEALTKFDFSNDFEPQHVAMEILKEKGFVEYERRKRKDT